MVTESEATQLDMSAAFVILARTQILLGKMADKMFHSRKKGKIWAIKKNYFSLNMSKEGGEKEKYSCFGFCL